MFFSKQSSLTDNFHSHGILEFNGKGYHVRKDGAISIVWKVDAGNALRFTEPDFQGYTAQMTKTINLLPPYTQIDFLYDKYETHWDAHLKSDLTTNRPEIVKLMEIRRREIGVRAAYTLDVYLIVTFNHLIQYKAPMRQDFFLFNRNKFAQLTRGKFEQDGRHIENTAALIENELRCFSFSRLSGNDITDLLKSYYNLTHQPAELNVRREQFNGDLLYKNFSSKYDDLVIGLDHMLVASMIELPDKAVNPIEVDKRFLRSPLECFLSLPFRLRLAVRMEKMPHDKARTYITLNKLINKPRFNNLASMKMIELDGDENGQVYPGISNLIEFEKDFLADISLTLMTWHPDKVRLAERQERIISAFTRFFNSRGMIEYGQDALNAFLSCAPGNYPYRRITVRGAHLGHFVNLSDHYKGMNSGVPLINTNDAPVYYDLFSTENANYNSLIVGPSGKGKSFFCNSLIFNYIAQGVQVIALDLSGSYKPLADVLRSDYIQIDRRKPNYLDPFHYFNPLSHQHDSPEYLETLTYLQSFLNLMVKEESDTKYMSKDKKAVIYDALEKFLQARHGGAINIHTFWNFLRENGDNIFEDDTTFYRYVVKTLSYYLEKSALKIYFDPGNQNHLSISRDKPVDLIAFDLKGIEKEIELMPLYSNLLSMLVMNALHRDFKRFLFILDESWKALESSEIIYGLVRETGRTSRKHFGSVAALTQNIKDLQQGDLGASVLTNSYSKFLLPHSGEDVETAIQVLDMTRAEQRAFRNLKEHEILLSREGEPIIFRIPFSKQDYWIWTTRPDEVHKRNQQMRYDKNVISAISALAETNPTQE
ncbi:MAG: VirB4 family type IV secretion system protein [bacterium]